MVNFVDQIFPVLLKTLSDSSDEVLILNLQVLAEICCPPTKNSTGSDSNLNRGSDITTMNTTKDNTITDAQKKKKIINVVEISYELSIMLFC